MAFSDFTTIAKIQTRYTIRYQQANFIANGDLDPPDNLVKDI